MTSHHDIKDHSEVKADGIWAYHRKNSEGSFYLGTLKKTGGCFFYLNDTSRILSDSSMFNFSYNIEEDVEKVFPWEMFI